jgi:hypothetical protein
MRVHVVAAAYALWILGTFVVFYAISRDENPLQLALMADVIPACCQLLLLGIDWCGLVAPTKIWLALLLIVLLSYVVNAMDPVACCLVAYRRPENPPLRRGRDRGLYHRRLL